MWSLRVENDHMSMQLCTLHYGNVVYSRLKSDCMCIVDYIHGNLHCGNVYRVLIVQVPTGFSSTTWFIRLHMSVIGQFDKDCSNSTVLYSSSVCMVMNEKIQIHVLLSQTSSTGPHTNVPISSDQLPTVCHWVSILRIVLTQSLSWSHHIMSKPTE